MIEQISRHGLFDLTVKAKGDLHIDAHHTVEDIGITLGQAFLKAMGDKLGIRRYGHAYVPLDEAFQELYLISQEDLALNLMLNLQEQELVTFDVDLIP